MDWLRKLVDQAMREGIEVVRSDLRGMREGWATPIPQQMNVLRRGVKSESVGKIQDLLTQLKILKPVGRHRCHYGPKTERAVRAFQALHNLPNNGIVDSDTWHALRHQQQLATTASEPPLTDTELRDVRRLLRKHYG